MKSVHERALDKAIKTLEVIAYQPWSPTIMAAEDCVHMYEAAAARCIDDVKRILDNRAGFDLIEEVHCKNDGDQP